MEDEKQNFYSEGKYRDLCNWHLPPLNQYGRILQGLEKLTIGRRQKVNFDSHDMANDKRKLVECQPCHDFCEEHQWNSCQASSNHTLLYYKFNTRPAQLDKVGPPFEKYEQRFLLLSRVRSQRGTTMKLWTQKRTLWPWVRSPDLEGNRSNLKNWTWTLWHFQNFNIRATSTTCLYGS